MMEKLLYWLGLRIAICTYCGQKWKTSSWCPQCSPEVHYYTRDEFKELKQLSEGNKL